MDRPDLTMQARLAEPLRIRRVDAIPIAVPLTKPMTMAGNTVRSADNLLVRIEAANGIVGWGEAAAAPTMTGDTRDAMVAAVRDHLAPLLVGQDARDRASLLRACGGALYGNTGAKSAVEIALHDLAGRGAGVSLADLLGGAVRRELTPMWLLGNSTPDADVAEAVACVARGVDFFKLKVGSKGVAGDIETALALRRTLGPHIRLCADANGGLTLPAALAFLAGAEAAGLDFLEQPLPADNLAGLTRLCRGGTAIGADEGIHSFADIDAHAAAGALGVSLKLIKLGGPMAVLRAMMVCERHGLAINVAAKVAETGLGAAATAHLACLAPNADWGVSLTNVYLADDILVRPFLPNAGRITLPDGPGLGVEVDEAAVARVRASG